MFDQDQARVERWCKNPDKFLKVGTMVLLSIRMQWVGVGTQMASVDELGADSPCLWGFKRDGFVYLRTNRKALYKHVKDCRAGRIRLNDLMREFLKVPGLGLAKAGFLCQLLTGDGGCLDMHNIARFQLDAKHLTIPKRKNTADQIQAVDDAIAFYLGLCVQCGGSELLWNEWCELLADKVGTFENAEDVSQRHYIYLLDIPGD